MELNERIRELIAIGASITANCQPNLKAHMEKALDLGADRQEVAAAMEIGRGVRKGAAAGMEAFSASLLGGTTKGFDVVMEANGYQFLGP